MLPKFMLCVIIALQILQSVIIPSSNVSKQVSNFLKDNTEQETNRENHYVLIHHSKNIMHSRLLVALRNSGFPDVL